MKAFIILTLFISSSAFALKQKVVQFETTSPSTELEKPGQAFCITNVSPTALYQTISNARGLRNFICDVNFEGLSIHDHTSIRGTRTINYRTTPVVLDRNRLKPQSDYLRDLEDNEHMVGFVAIPNSVYKLMPNVSRRSEAESIARDSYALIPSDQNFGIAVRTACYVAMLETLTRPCTGTDLDLIRADVERKIHDLNSNQTQVIYTTQESP